MYSDFSIHRKNLYQYVWAFGMHMSGRNVGLLFQSGPTTHFFLLRSNQIYGSGGVVRNEPEDGRWGGRHGYGRPRPREITKNLETSM